MKGLLTPLLLASALALSGCELTDEEKEKLDNAAVDLQQLADQIIITYPAKDSEITDSMVTVRADIPASAQAQEVRLLVDGIEIAVDSDGAPWEIEWPAYYFADGGKHTLLLKTITGEGNEVRNNEQFQVTIKEEANEALIFEEGIDGRSIQDEGSLSFTFAAFEGATGYEVLVDGELFTTDTASINLSNLTVGTHSIQYRVLHDRLDETPFSQAVTFEVLPAALPTLNEVVIDGINITLSWETISEGDSYDIYWGEEGSAIELVDSINTNSYTIAEAETGNFEWAIRRTNALGQQSILSDKTAVELLPPVLPVINEPVVEYQEGGYQITLSWEAITEGDSYTVYFGNQSEAIEAQTATTSNFVVLSDLEPGQYQWKLQRTNAVSQSVTSETYLLSAGAFKLQLGGSGDEWGRHIIASQDGGAIILASTGSQGDSQGDDWFIKLDANGNIEWDYVLKKSGSTRLRDLFEFSDGSIYAIGYTDWSDQKGLLVKLSGELAIEDRLLWESNYRTPGADKETFSSLTELEGNLYVAGSGRTCTTEGGTTRCEYSHNNLHNFDTESGDFVSSVTIPHPTGALLDGFGNLSTTNSDDLLLACSAKPEIEEEYFMGAACLIHFDIDGNLIWSWDSTTTYGFGNGRYALEAPWGGFVLAGQGVMGDGVPIGTFNTTGENQGIYTASGGYSNQRETIVFDDDNMLRLISGWDSDYPELWSTSRYGNTEVIKVFRELKYDYSYPASLAKSKDGRLLTLFSESQSGHNNEDLIIMKTDMQGNM